MLVSREGITWPSNTSYQLSMANFSDQNRLKQTWKYQVPNISNIMMSFPAIQTHRHIKLHSFNSDRHLQRNLTTVVIQASIMLWQMPKIQYRYESFSIRGWQALVFCGPPTLPDFLPFKVHWFPLHDARTLPIASPPCRRSRRSIRSLLMRNTRMPWIVSWKNRGHILGVLKVVNHPENCGSFPAKKHENVCLTFFFCWDTFLEKKSKRCWRCCCLATTLFFWWKEMSFLVRHFCLITRVVRCTGTETCFWKTASQDDAESHERVQELYCWWKKSCTTWGL